MIKPPKLVGGDTIGVIAPSRYVVEQKKQINKSVNLLEKSGFRVIFGDNINRRYFQAAGTPEERAKDLNCMIANKKIKMIFCANGGDSANQILDLIDYKLIRSNPKIIIGYSDITNLILAITKKTGLITFHGPNLSKFFQINSVSKKFLISLITKQKTKLPKDFKVIKHGSASGKLLGGNLFVINSLAATDYNIDFKNAILFWEDIDEGLSTIEFQLNQLKLNGILDKISGMVIGHIVKVNKENRPVEDIIIELTKGLKFPIIKVDYFGHNVKEFYALPNGAGVKLNTETNEFKLTESPVE